MEDQCIGTMFPNFVLIAPFLACLHASKEGKNTKHMGSDVKKADFAAGSKNKIPFGMFHTLVSLFACEFQ